MSEDADKKRKCIEFAKNAENPNDLQKVEEALNSIDQEDLVEVALDAKNSNFAMKAVNKILKGNQDLLADVAKNAKDCEVAMLAAGRIRKKEAGILYDLAQNASHKEVRDYANNRIAGQKHDFKEKRANKNLINKLSSQKEPVQKIDDNIGIIHNQKVQRKAKTHYETDSEKRKRIKEQNEFLDMFKNDAVYDFLKIMFERAGGDNQKAFVLIARNAYDRNVAMAALERIDYDNNQKGLSDIARNAYGWHVAKKALENINIKNQMILKDIARNSNHMEVRIEALSMLSGDNYYWAQKKLVYYAKNAYEEVLAQKALEKIRYNEDGFFDVAKNSKYDSVAVAAFEKIDTDQSGWIDLAKNANGQSVSRRAFDKISSVDSNVWVDIANNAKVEYVAKRACDKIGEDNQYALANIARNSIYDSVVRKALSKLSDETLNANPSLNERKVKIAQEGYKGYKFNPSYGSNANNTSREKFFR